MTELIGREDQIIEVKPMAPDERFLAWLVERKKIIAWVVVIGLLLWLAVAVKEITSLLLLAYAVAILADPLMTRLEKRGISRGTAVIAICALLLILCLLLLVIAVPAIIRQYSALVAALPSYLQSLSVKLGDLAQTKFGVSLESELQEASASAREYLSAIGWEQVKRVFQTLGSTVLKGYSLTLTIFNLLLLPFFVFYIARDLHGLHRLIGGFLPPNLRRNVTAVSSEILVHVYAFFKGQLTVSFIMAVLYAAGLTLVGMPSGFVIGILAGMLNLVPYLGLAIGITLSLIITLVTDPSWSQLGLVAGVFVFVQAMEGMVLTPKIVGESVGIHPLVVMVALIIGGQLLGLLGIIIAVPAAASLRVLFKHLLRAIEDRPLVELTDEVA